jgi:hypothetical protein
VEHDGARGDPEITRAVVTDALQSTRKPSQSTQNAFARRASNTRRTGIGGWSVIASALTPQYTGALGH